MALAVGAGSVRALSRWPRRIAARGLAIALVLVGIYFLITFWSVKLFARSNSIITVFKLIVPAMTAVCLMLTGFHRANFSVGTNARM